MRVFVRFMLFVCLSVGWFVCLRACLLACLLVYLFVLFSFALLCFVLRVCGFVCLIDYLLVCFVLL